MSPGWNSARRRSFRWPGSRCAATRSDRISPLATLIHLEELEVEGLAAHRAQRLLHRVLACATGDLDDLAERRQARDGVALDQQPAAVLVDDRLC